MSSHSVVNLAKELIAQRSVTPEDADCQKIIAERLSACGFNIEFFPFGPVTNLYARRGNSEPVFLFAGHTDVVPPGPLNEWTSDPFQPEIRDGYLYGRGATDMKSSIAAMICACENFIRLHPNHKGSIAFLITSDEEGEATNGTVKVLEQLTQRSEKLTWCLVGEASCEQILGDTIKVGRRGSLNGKLLIHGKQGHIAYPYKADNPIHRSLLALHEMCITEWDQGNDFFPPTSFQISNIRAGTGADNVIPGVLEVIFNFRYSPVVTVTELQERIEEILNRYALVYDISWRHSGNSFMTSQGKFLKVAQQIIHDETGIQPKLSTTGGTSDGRFIATTGCEVMEFGPCNTTAHQINESINVEDLKKLSDIYQRLLDGLLV